MEEIRGTAPGEVDPRAIPDRPGPRAPLPRPRVAVILAAGRSERLHEVTGGGSKALVRLGGLALVERSIRTALGAGIERVVVVCGFHAGPVATVATRTAPGRVQVVVAEAWERGNGASLSSARPAVADEPSFLLLTADHVFAEGALEDLLGAGVPAVLVDPRPGPAVWDEGTKVEIGPDGAVLALGKELDAPLVDCGAFLLGPDAFVAALRGPGGHASLSSVVTGLARRRRVAAVPLRSGLWWQDVDTPEDLRRARRLLRRSLRRDSDGPISRWLNRRISIPISWALAPLRPDPDLLSVLAFAAGLVGAWLLGAGHGLAGGLLVQACSILDGVDGEVARLTLRAGPRGTLLDGVMDRLSDAAVAAGLGLWAAAQGHAPHAVILAVVAATTGALLSMSTKDRIAALGLAPPSERRLGMLLGGRDGRLALAAGLAIAGLPLVALIVTAATSLVASILRVTFARTFPPG